MRRSILEKLSKWKQKDTRKPLILQGCRQIGKTYILKYFAKQEFKQSHYINFEEAPQFKDIFDADLSPQNLIQLLSHELSVAINPKQDILILDEIQDCPRALTSLKYFCEKMPELAICAAGSLLGVHLNEFSFPVGKVDELNMHPMSFKEFLQALDLKLLEEYLDELPIKKEVSEVAHNKLWDLLKIYFIVGGLPELVKLYVVNKDDSYTALNLVRERQRDLLRNYMADMAKHSGKENSVHLEKVWRSIPLQLSKEINGAAGRFRFKGVIPGRERLRGVAGTIEWLEAAGLIIKIPILHSAEKPLLAYSKDNMFKLFVFDVGILGALAGIAIKDILDYDYGTYKGYFAENFVAQEFEFSRRNFEKVYAWGENKSELEFIREIDGEIYPIEVKSGKVVKSKSLQIFADKYQVPYKTILSAQNLQINQQLKLHKYPLYLAANFPLS